MNILASVDTITILNDEECIQTGSCHYRMEFSSWFSINMYNLSDYDFYRNIKDPQGNWHSTPGTLSECLSSGICTEIESDHVDFSYTHPDSGSVVVNMQVEDSWGGDYAAATLYHDVDIVIESLVCDENSICSFQKNGESDTENILHSAVQSGNTIYVGRENSIALIDITGAPVFIKKISLIGPIHSLVVKNSVLYASNNNSVVAYDISNSANPILTNTYELSPPVGDILNVGDYFYIPTGNAVIVAEIDGANVIGGNHLMTDAPVLATHHDTLNNQLVITMQNSVKLANISTPFSPDISATIYITGIQSSYVLNGILYVYSTAGLSLYDLNTHALIRTEPLSCSSSDFADGNGNIFLKCAENVYQITSTETFLSNLQWESLQFVHVPINLAVIIRVDIHFCSGAGVWDSENDECFCDNGYTHELTPWLGGLIYENPDVCVVSPCTDQRCSGHPCVVYPLKAIPNVEYYMLSVIDCECGDYFDKVGLMCETKLYTDNDKDFSYKYSELEEYLKISTAEDRHEYWVDNVPWPETYAPITNDSFTMIWENPDQNAVKKYQQAFRPNYISEEHPEENLLDKDVSRIYGILSLTAECEENSDCDTGIPAISGTCLPYYNHWTGETIKRCGRSWGGYCGHWSHSSISESEPKHPVTVDDVTFELDDIKLLTTFSYTAFDSETTGADVISEKDAGAALLIIANLIGKKRISAVADLGGSQAAWNYPLFAYKITDKSILERWPNNSPKTINITTVLYKIVPYSDEGTSYNQDYMKSPWVEGINLLRVKGLDFDYAGYNNGWQLDALTQSLEIEYNVNVDRNGFIVESEFTSFDSFSTINTEQKMTLNTSNGTLTNSLVRWSDIEYLIQQSQTSQ